MMYLNRFDLTANKPQNFSTINMSSTRHHFFQINYNSSVTVRATLMIGASPIDIETITGPGLFRLEISPQQFELVSNNNATVILSGN